MLRLETLGTEDVFETSCMVESIGLLCLVRICFPIIDISGTYEGGELNPRPALQILEVETIVGLDIYDASQIMSKT